MEKSKEADQVRRKITKMLDRNGTFRRDKLVHHVAKELGVKKQLVEYVLMSEIKQGDIVEIDGTYIESV